MNQQYTSLTNEQMNNRDLIFDLLEAQGVHIKIIDEDYTNNILLASTPYFKYLTNRYVLEDGKEIMI